MGTPILYVSPLLTHKGPWTSLTHTSSKVKLLHVPRWRQQQGITPACGCMDPGPVKHPPPPPLAQKVVLQLLEQESLAPVHYSA